ncbi:MAG: hypothetical protein COW52_05220 [Nitrospirae bacterium CG17_big_fil_post_rev_8_21_14_2_50_50_9]|nr:MAG: hypothetical protein COW52_05220 [Nitrospirae bacterium CG17_big_fil_post_rev_8_21_14_2_50_50_9]
MPKQGRGILIFLLSMMAVGVLSLLSRVPFRILTALGAGLGAAYYHLDSKRKKIGVNNLRLALGKSRSEKEIRRILKSVYRHMGSSLFEFAAVPRLNPERLYPLVRIQGLEKIDAAMKTGRGVIILGAHMGNWELYAQAGALHGYPVHVIGRKANVNLLNDYMVRIRECHGNRVILRTHAMRKVLRVLQEGGALGVMCDQRGSTSRGLMINFFGQPAPTSPALARIILKSGAVVLTSFGFRNPDRTHTLAISGPLAFDPGEDTEKNIREITQLYMKALEDFIRLHPDQWLWMHRRWMKRSPGSSRRA